jgi:hypothetical protein
MNRLKYAKLKYLGKTLKNQNNIHNEIKRRLRSGNAGSYSLQNILFSRLISKTISIKIHKSVILPLVLNGCETWPVTLREEHRLRVSEKSMLRQIFVHERAEDGSWRKWHNDEFLNPYSSTNNGGVIESRKKQWAGHVGRMGEGIGVHKVLIGWPEGKRLLRRARCRWGITLCWTIQTKESMGRTGFSWLRVGPGGGS